MLKYTITIHKRYKRKKHSKWILVDTIVDNSEKIESKLRSEKKYGPLSEEIELQFSEGNYLNYETKNYEFKVQLFSLTSQELTRIIFNSETYQI